jgi:site-specific DNA-cytosine methylase
MDNGQRRLLTIPEAAILQSFPPEHFDGIKETIAARMIGNSVPPLLSKCFAHVIHAWCLDNCRNFE